MQLLQRICYPTQLLFLPMQLLQVCLFLRNYFPFLCNYCKVIFLLRSSLRSNCSLLCNYCREMFISRTSFSLLCNYCRGKISPLMILPASLSRSRSVTSWRPNLCVGWVSALFFVAHKDHVEAITTSNWHDRWDHSHRAVQRPPTVRCFRLRDLDGGARRFCARPAGLRRNGSPSDCRSEGSEF